MGDLPSAWPAAMVWATGTQGQCLPGGKSSHVWFLHAAPWLVQNRAEQAGSLPPAYLGSKSDFTANWQVMCHH